MKKRFSQLALFILILTPSLCAGRTLKVGVASMITPVSAVRYYQEIVDYLGRGLGMEAEMVHRTTYDEIDRMLEQKKIDLAFICSAPYVMDHEQFGVELLAAPLIKGRPFYRSYIITHRDAAFTRMEDLKGKSFAFVDPKSNSGRIYPLYWLAKRNLDPDSFFSRYIFTYSHNKSVEMVAKQKIAAAAVDSSVYDYMISTESPYAKETRIIHRSGEFGIPPVVVPAGTPLFLKEKLRETLTHMHENPDGLQILQGMHIDRFVEADDSNYDSIRAMRRTIAQSSKRMPAQAESDRQDGRVLITVTPRDNPRIAYDLYQPLIDYLKARTGLPFELLLKKSINDTVNAIGRGDAQFAILDPLAYLDAHKRFKTEIIARGKTAEGKPWIRSIIITTRNHDEKDLSSLVGHRFAFGSLWSASGNLIPRYMLARAGIHLDQLAGYHNFNYHDTVVKKVLSGEYDAGAVRQTVAARYLPLGLKVIAESEPIPTSPVVAAPGAPYLMVRRVQEAILNMAEDPEGQKALKKMDPDLAGGFLPASDENYSGIRKLINDVPRSCGRGCHPAGNF